LSDFQNSFTDGLSILAIAPLTILDISALQPRNWQLAGTGCSTAVRGAS